MTYGAKWRRASAHTRRRHDPLERKVEGDSPAYRQAIDIITGNAPRAVSKHIRSSFPDPARNRHCQKEHFPSLRNHKGPAARALGVLDVPYLQLICTVTRGFFLPVKIIGGLVVKRTHRRVRPEGRRSQAIESMQAELVALREQVEQQSSTR